MANYNEARLAIKKTKKGNKKHKVFFAVVLLLIILAFLNRSLVYSKYEEVKGLIASLAEKNSDRQKHNASFSLTLVDDDISGYEKRDIESVIADSILVSSKGKKYVPDYLIDNDLTTSWQEGADDFGKDKRVDFVFKKTDSIKYIVIYNGNQASSELFTNNNRIKSIEVAINNQHARIELLDTMEPQILRVDDNKECKELGIIIESVYAGDKWNDTCIAEVQFY